MPMKLQRLVSAAVIVLCLSLPLFAGNKDEGPQSSLAFVVLKDESGKPVRNAAVVLHPVGKHGKQSKGGFELKTDNEGKTHFDGIPYGPLRIQVIAPGFQTFGDDYEINQADQVITVRLKRPQGQYSIYENHAGSGNSGGGDNSGSANPGTTPPK
jgi:Carboxypeptidase regulatory-like domain